MTTTPRKLLAALTLLALATGGLAAAQPSQLATVAVGGGGLSLQPQIQYEAAVLAVAGKDRLMLWRRFEPQEPIAFAPVDPEGHPLADGTYLWELRLVLDPEGIEGVKPRIVTQSGRFAVLGGLIQGVSALGPAVSGPSEGGAGEPIPAGAAGTCPSPCVVDGDPATLHLMDTSDDDYFIEADGDVLTVKQLTTPVLTLMGDTLGIDNNAPDGTVTLDIGGTQAMKISGTLSQWKMEVAATDFEIKQSQGGLPTTVMVLEDTGSAYELQMTGNGVFSGDFTAGSSRSVKRDLEPAAREELLAVLNGLPLFTWSYKTDAEGVRHVGPMAEDFHAAFGLGRDDKHISPSDSAGVALAAIQALTERLDERERRIAELESRLAALEASAD